MASVFYDLISLEKKLTARGKKRCMIQSGHSCFINLFLDFDFVQRGEEQTLS